MGRPTTYTVEMATQILDALASGELLRDICNRPGMPGPGTIYGWRERYRDFAASFLRARHMQAESLAERAVQGAQAATPATAHADRLKFDADKWLAAKLDPVNWSDKPNSVNVQVNVNATARGIEARRILLDHLDDLEAGPDTTADDPHQPRFAP